MHLVLRLRGGPDDKPKQNKRNKVANNQVEEEFENVIIKENLTEDVI